MNRHPKLIIFDFDGTLADTGPGTCAILNQMRKEKGLRPLPYETLKTELSHGGKNLISRALEISITETTKKLAVFRQRYLKNPNFSSILYPHVRKTLKTLKKNGIKICICTNKPRYLLEKILIETKITSLFDFTNAGGDLPDEKPDPSTVKSCLSFCDLTNEEAVFVGDSSVDQACAYNTNIPFYLFSGGYADKKLDRKKVDFIFNDYQDLLGHLNLN